MSHSPLELNYRRYGNGDFWSLAAVRGDWNS